MFRLQSDRLSKMVFIMTFHEGQRGEYMERFFLLVAGREENEIDYVLYVVEHLLKGLDRCLE